ncbi:nickel transporter [Curvibacter sp. HBC28]|uniref:Nickel/cobalt efflux system n=1 Tax=Curvibacter microcysteis TaxID=3026419 RepID=A0ABT5MBC1_9BURK|nr:nickel transporter [Curvibacter sp. HBC28]MDD0813700.1 nickel transporter [Curvibacter sp. HBC28]
MSPDFGTSAVLSLMLAFSLGVRHGFDTDHLVAIDSLTRLHFQAYPRLAPWCGVFFSLGHGFIVLLIALATDVLRAHWSAPDWLVLTGNGLSIGFLFLLGWANLRQVLFLPSAGTGPDPAPAAPWWLARLTQRLRHPLAAGLVGALFAISYDTVGQAVLFGSSALAGPTAAHPVGLALAFLLGMLCVDGAAGWWMSSLLSRPHGNARRVSRSMGLTVALMSLGMATLGVARQCSGVVDAWAQGSGLWLSLGSLLLLTASFLYARLSTRPEAAGPHPSRQ